MQAPLILQTYLDEVGSAVMADDWVAYRPCIQLPCHVVSFALNKVVATEAELHQGFDDFRDLLRFHRVTDYVRLVEQAVQLEQDMISGAYLSHLLASGQRLLEPFRSLITLRRSDGRWRAVSVTNGLANSRWSQTRPNPSLSTDPTKPDPKEPTK